MSQETKPKGQSAESTPSPAAPAQKRSSWLPVIVLAGVFLVGFVPMWLKASRLSGQLFEAQRHSRVEQIQITLANAALDARRGEYEPARRAMTNFYSLLTAELDRGIGSALPPGASVELQPLLTERDELITLLARGDPASAERLSIAYATFRKSAGR